MVNINFNCLLDEHSNYILAEVAVDVGFEETIIHLSTNEMFSFKK